MGVNSGAGSGAENSDDSSLKISQSTHQRQMSHADARTELEESKGRDTLKSSTLKSSMQTPSIDLAQNIPGHVVQIDEVRMSVNMDRPIPSTRLASTSQSPQKKQ